MARSGCRFGPGFVTVLALVLSAGLAAAPAQLTLPLLPQGPDLRGDLSDVRWQQAARAAPFVSADGTRPPLAATEGCVLGDAQYLYVGFVCHEPTPGKLVAGLRERDGSVWADDCVELTLDVTHGQTWIYHWAVNSLGTLWDGIHGPRGSSFAYDSQTTTACAVGADRWTCELRIPWADVGGRPEPGEVWGINFCRERKVEPAELSSWAPTPGGFTDPAGLGELRLPPAPGPVTLTILARGGLSTDVDDVGQNSFQVQVSNGAPGAAAVQATVLVAGGEETTRTETVAAGQTALLRVPYLLPAQGQPEVTCRVAVEGTGRYERRQKALPPRTQEPRSWVVPDPLFRELLTEQPPPRLAGEGCLMWAHMTHDPALLRETAKRFATRYVLDEAYGEYGAFHCKLVSGDVPEGETAAAYARHGLGAALYGPEQAPGVPWILDPASIEHYLAEFSRRLQAPHAYVWGIYAGDESNEIALEQGAKLKAAPPPGYAYLQEADAEVKRLYGGGQWGIPEGPSDPSPYRWIAFRRWCNEKFRQRHVLLRDLVRKQDPSLRLISLDPIDRLAPYEWSSQAECFDIFTQQFTPRRTPWRALLGCMTKVLTDLTGREVWPCAHVENYTMDTTPAEVVAELSQIPRNGGHGVHLYMPDTGNGGNIVGDTRICFFGSPERYHTTMNIVHQLRHLPRPRYPADTRQAILYNDDSLLAEPYQGGPWLEHTVEACYTILGPLSRSWFTFIDSAQVLQWPSLKERFDLIYLPLARYQRPEVVARLAAFVQQGGTLICTDPNAFATDLVGNDTSLSRRELFGVDIAPEQPVNAFVPQASGLGQTAIEFKTHEVSLKPVVEGVAVLAAWDTGGAVITSRAVGQGRAILFARNLVVLPHLADAQWRQFFQRWVTWTGVPTGLDIWRFTFPDTDVWKAPLEPGVCLTNNHVVWTQEHPIARGNLDSGATYRYSLAPDAMPDAAPELEWIPGAVGHLTDRRQSSAARKVAAAWYAAYELPASRWMVSWDRPDALSVTFDLQRTWPLTALKLWFCDSLPGLTVEASVDGQEWRLAGRGGPLEAGPDVCDLETRLAPQCSGRYLRLNVAARSAGQKLSLIEAEIWGPAAPRTAER